MKSELGILNKLQQIIATKINDYLDEDLENTGELPTLSIENVKVDYPDTDTMPKSTMIYLEPDSENIETLTNQSDLASFSVTAYILVKRDLQENLLKKVFGYSTALYSLLKKDQSLDGYVDFINIEYMQFYPAVEANPNIKAIELTILINWSKDWF